MPNNATDLGKALERSDKAFGKLINYSCLSRRYFGKSQGWFSQRMNGCVVSGKAMSFSVSECRMLASAYRNMAQMLVLAADDIDNAADKMEK